MLVPACIQRRIRSNPGGSYLAGNGTSIQIFAENGCRGKRAAHWFGSFCFVVGLSPSAVFSQGSAVPTVVCVTGRGSGKLPIWGTVTGALEDDVESFILCYEPQARIGSADRPYPINLDD